MSRPLEITGRRFGTLIVVCRDGSNSHGRSLWLCECDCGNRITVRGDALMNHGTKGCGCYRVSHGHNTRKSGRTKPHIAWGSMVQRCTNPRSSGYHNYGGRGIGVCSEWHNFENFFRDMGKPPTDRHQLDRIDNNGHYCPENCRWTTPKQNSRNRRDNRIICFNGKTQCLSAWAEEIDISAKTLSSRLIRGWSVKRALTELIRR